MGARCRAGPLVYGIEGSVGVGRVGSGGSVGISDVGAGVGVGVAPIVGMGVDAGADVTTGDDAGAVGANNVDAVGADEACGRCVGATEAVTSRGRCVARIGVGEPAGPAEVRAGGRVAGELRSTPATPEEMCSGTMTRMPTTTPSVAPMMISRSCSIALRFVSKNRTCRLPDPTRCALRLTPMIGPVKETTA